ncbi:flagellar motor switch phosphatase FliY [Planococcus salinus]|uniref:Flagellar motor switch phosphatase FliY n=1 Tax=Planococcus salinus TaxID=1848460 RepID=A0A3M8P507_9BACL|nr:flagellar motor switch phosphatase FliY [Planococcus salinus]RNF38747.1 flagellar motor switch phosphatase FliY [Planococcus salinus]
MIDEKLSPDEISGLLGQVKAEGKKVPDKSLSKMEKEVLTELLSVSLGSSAAVLSPLFMERVSFTAPVLSVKQKDRLLDDAPAPLFIVLGEYTGSAGGLQVLTFARSDVRTFVEMAATDAEDTSAEDQEFQVMQGVVQQMFTAVSRAMGTVLEQELSYSLSGMDVIEKQEDFPVGKFTAEEWFAEARFQLKIGDEESVDFHLHLPLPLAKQWIGVLTDSLDEEDFGGTQEMDNQSNGQSNEPNKAETTGSSHHIQKVQFSNFDDTATSHSEPNNLDMLFDIPLQVTVELGRTKRTVKEILEVSKGSIIELDKLAGEPVDILVNNKLIAVGEVVVIDENFGVRVTDILSAADRISKLR